jgi:hypothetical protein
MYKQIKDKYGVITNTICRVEDNAFIPMDDANTDYQAYLKWLAEGNTPLPADEVTQ